MGTWNFSYDHLNRLASAIPGTGAPSGYSGEKLCMAYDSFGNRTQSNFQTTACSTSNPATANYSAANLVTWSTVNSASNGFTYDASGNVLFDGVNYYAYDSEGQVCAVQNSPITGGTVAYGYLYDADGRRVAKGTITVTSTPLAASVCNPATNGFQLTESYVLGQGGEQLTTLNVDGSWQRTNVYDYQGRLISDWGEPADQGGSDARIYWGNRQFAFRSWDDGQTYFNHHDYLGTERMRTNASGQVAATFFSLPFGDDQQVTTPIPSGYPPPQEQKFAMNDYDGDSNTFHAQFRNYNLSLGRWLSPDPYDGSYDITNPQSFNRYAYALNNPLSFKDPSGLDCQATEGGWEGCDPGEAPPGYSYSGLNGDGNPIYTDGNGNIYVGDAPSSPDPNQGYILTENGMGGWYGISYGLGAGEEGSAPSVANGVYSNAVPASVKCGGQALMSNAGSLALDAASLVLTASPLAPESKVVGVIALGAASTIVGAVESNTTSTKGVLATVGAISNIFRVQAAPLELAEQFAKFSRVTGKALTGIGIGTDLTSVGIDMKSCLGH